jgi:hypothetical protein
MPLMPSRRSESPRRRCLPAALSLLLAAACSGSLGGSEGAAGSGKGGPAAPGSSSGRGGPGSPSGPAPAFEPAPAAQQAPGRSTMRRMTRAEYDNTIRDLLGTSTRVADGFPADDAPKGFDTVGAGLTYSALHFEQLQEAAGKHVDELFAPGLEARLSRVVSCDVEAGGEACHRATLRAFARRAFRRPVAEEEIAPHVALVARAKAEGASFTEGMKAALMAILSSPHFLFLVETDPDPRSPTPHLVNDHELAVRLSYFLWSSMPDEPLFAAADGGKLLGDKDELGRQLERMLADEKAQGFVDNFAGQWLTTRTFEAWAPVQELFPAFDPALRTSMKRESELFFRHALEQDLPLEELLTSRFTFVNERLARHYGISGVTGAEWKAEWKKVSLEQTQRAGLLGQGSILALTSFPERTAPTFRGKFVLDHLLCQPPPPPPPEVPELPMAAAAMGATVRERLEIHRTNPDCAACHSVMDPIGLALERFDAVGAERAMDGGKPIDARGELPDGRKFDGALELAATLAGDPRFARCFVQQLLTYATGRAYDEPKGQSYVEALAARIAAAGGTLKAALGAVLVSDAFLTRSGEKE